MQCRGNHSNWYMGSLASSFVLFALYATPCQATQYRGDGGLIEAFGMLVGGFYSGWKAPELCGRFPALTKEAEKAKQGYAARNQPLFLDISKKMEHLARENGGDAELQHLKSKLREAKAIQKELDEKMLKSSPDEASCRKLIAITSSGNLDLQKLYAREVVLINAAALPPREKSYAGLTFGQSRDQVMQVLKGSSNITKINTDDSFTLEFQSAPIPIRDVLKGWAFFRNNKLSEIALRFFPASNASLLNGFRNLYRDVKERIIEKYGAPYALQETLSGDYKTDKASAFWLDGDVKIHLEYSPPDGGITLFYTHTKLAQAKESSGL